MKNLLTILFLIISITASATTYYVSSAGNDSNNGTSASTPWATIAKINGRTFSAGDQILFNRGDTWSTGNFVFPSSGTAGNPIILSSYGSGNAPVFSYTGASYLIRLTNKQYVTIDGIKITDNTISSTDHSITSKIWYAIGLNNSSNITIKNCDISLVGTGIEVSNGSGYATIANNHIYNLRMVINTPGGGDDFGANPIIIGGSNNTITGNTFEECWATSYDYQYDGGAIEFFSNGGASISNNKITNNTAINCNGFLEIGAQARGTCANNVIAYNKIINCGIIGSYHTTDAMGMDISNLQYYNNDVVQTVLQYTKPGVLFYGPTAYPSGMLVVKNNIFWMADGTDITWGGFTAAQMTHTNNIYRMTTGSVGLTLGSGESLSSTANVFMSTSGDPSTWNLQLISGSPAIKAGVNVGLTSDFAGSTSNNPPSIGIYESGSTALVLPVYVSSTVASTASSLLEMTYNTTLANIIPATSAFSVMVNSVARTVSTVAISGTKVQLTLTSPIVSGNVVTVAYTKPAANPLQTASAGQAESLSPQTVVNGVTAVTGSVPAYVSSVVENATPSLLVLTYSLNLSTAKIPPASSYSVIVNGVARTVSTVSISTNKVQMNLASAVKYGDVITTTYTKPATNPLQTTDGGIAASFSATATTNNLSAVIKDAAPVTISMTISPYYIFRTMNVQLAYSSLLTTPQITAFTPEIIRIADTYGRLCLEKVLVTGSTSVKLPINLRSGIYNVLILTNGAQMASKRIRVY